MSNSENKYADDFVTKFMQDDQRDILSEAEDNTAQVNHCSGAGDRDLSNKILEEQVVLALKEIYDPEIPVNIYDLGLIYRIDVDDTGKAEVDMTLTTPGCPVAQTFPGMIQKAVENVDGINGVCVEVVWDPPWTPERMTEAAKLDLGML